VILDRLAKPWYVWRPWQLARRWQHRWTPSSGQQREMKTAWGVAITADPRTTIGWSIETTGVHDLAVTEALARLIRPGDTVLDIGAHIGYTVVLAAIAAGSRGQVIAWEPHPELFCALEKNVAAVSAERRTAAIDLRNAAVGSKAGRAALVRPPRGSANDSTSRVVVEGCGPDAELNVAVETIDDVLAIPARRGPVQIGVMKIDAEGGELEVMAGARSALEEHRIRHIVFEDHRGPSSDVMRVLESAGYEVFALGWTLRGLRIAPAGGGPLAAAYEAPSYIATLFADEMRARCTPAGWMTLRRSYADNASTQEVDAHR
jgi:FkbM family methyltransferase